MKKSGCDVPDWMLKLEKPSKSLQKKLKEAPPARESIVKKSSSTSKSGKKKSKKSQPAAEAPAAKGDD